MKRIYFSFLVVFITAVFPACQPMTEWGDDVVVEEVVMSISGRFSIDNNDDYPVDEVKFPGVAEGVDRHLFTIRGTEQNFIDGHTDQLPADREVAGHIESIEVTATASGCDLIRAEHFSNGVIPHAFGFQGEKLNPVSDSTELMYRVCFAPKSASMPKGWDNPTYGVCEDKEGCEPTAFPIAITTNSAEYVNIAVGYGEDVSHTTNITGVQGAFLKAGEVFEYAPGIPGGSYLAQAVRNDGGDSILENCQFQENIHFYIAVDGKAAVEMDLCTRVKDSTKQQSYLTGRIRVDGKFVADGTDVTYAGTVTPPVTCEQLGNCPTHTCEELGNCPAQTCEELGNCPPVTLQKNQVKVIIRTPGITTGNIKSAFVTQLWDNNDVVYSMGYPDPAHSSTLNDWGSDVIRGAENAITSDYMIKTNIQFAGNDWYCDWNGLDLNKGTVEIYLPDFNKTWIISSEIFRESNGDSGCDLVWGIRTKDTNNDNVADEVVLLQWNAAAAVKAEVL